MDRLLGLSLLLLFAPTAEAAEPTARSQGDRIIRARSILKKYCSECHATPGQSFDILNHAILTGKHPVAFVDPKPEARSQIIEFLEDGSMPPAGRQRPSTEEIQALRDWIAGGASAFPKAFDTTYVLDAIHADWAKQKPAENFRYLSFADSIQDSTTGLTSEETQLRAALAAATTRPVDLAAVDPAATVYRIDIAKLGWGTRDLFEPFDRRGDTHSLIPFDLLLLENPFPIADPKIEGYIPKPRALPPVPFLRANWVAAALAPGSPLAADLKSLVELQEAKEPICGPKPRSLESLKLAATGAAPITAWYSTTTAEPFKVQFTINGSTEPVVGETEELKFEVKSDVDANFRLIRILDDGYTSTLPVATGEVLKRNEPRTLTPSKGTFQSPSLKMGASMTREYYLLVVSPRENPIPVPTILRSLHEDGCEKEGRAPVRRVLFDKDDKFDSTKAVRKVVVLTVAKKK